MIVESKKGEEKRNKGILKEGLCWEILVLAARKMIAYELSMNKLLK